MKNTSKKIILSAILFCNFINAFAQMPYLVKDIAPLVPRTNLGGGPTPYFTDNNLAYFVIEDSIYGDELFTTNGTAIGTNMVSNISLLNDLSVPLNSNTAFVNFNFITEFNNAVYFVNTTNNSIYKVNSSGIGITHVFTPVETDECGTVPNTTIVLDTLDIDQFVVAGNTMYLFTNEHTCRNAFGDGIYISTDGINFTRTVNLGYDASFQSIPADLATKYRSYESDLTPFGNKIIFSTNNDLYISDGTQAGTQMLLPNTNFNNHFMKQFNNKIYFTARHPNAGMVIYQSDGTPAGTQLFYDADPSLTDTTYPSYYNPIIDSANNVMYFIANNQNTGAELYKTNGTIAGTSLVKDIVPGFISTFLNNLRGIAFNGKFYFYAYNGFDSLSGFYQTDGTIAGTIRISNVNVTSNIKILNGLMVFGGYVTKYDSLGLDISQTELWVSDGTSANTKMLYDIFPGKDADGFYFNSSSPHDFIKIKNSLYFSAEYAGGIEVFKLDSAMVPTAIHSPKLPIQLSVFPNPSNTYFNVQIASPVSTNYNITVTDALGKIITTQSLTNTSQNHHCKIDCQAWPTGNYFVAVKSANGASKSILFSKSKE